MPSVFIADIQSLDIGDFSTICHSLPFGALEQNRLMAISNGVYKKQSLCALIALERLLNICGIKPQSILRTPSGKPYFDGDKPLPFSLSHSGMLVAAALGDTADTSIGIDIELVDKQRDFDGLAKRFFSDGELCRFSSSGSAPDVFYELWTKKEALAKLSGEGLSSVISKKQSTQNIYFSTHSVCHGSTTAIMSICHDGDSFPLQIFTDEGIYELQNRT